MSAENRRKLSKFLYLPPEYHNLPLVCLEGIDNISTRLQKMKKRGSWFKNRTSDELNPILAQAQGHVQGIFDDLRKYKKGGSWDAAENVAWNTTRGARPGVRNEAFRRGFYSAWNTARDTAHDASGRGGVFEGASPYGSVWWVTAREAVLKMSRCMAWETIKDLPGFERNPFSHYLSLYELGAAGIRFGEVTDGDTGNKPEEMLIVHFPLKLKYDRGLLALACLAFPDGQLGDQEVHFFHRGWGWEPCSKITSLDLSRRRIIR